MPCGCGGGAAARREILRTTANQPTRDGGYTLMTYPGCTVLYRGVHEADSVYIVGRQTENERLFLRDDLAGATEYTIATRDQLENIPCTALCAQAVIDLFSTV